MAIESNYPYSNLLHAASESESSIAKTETTQDTLVPFLPGSSNGSRLQVFRHEESSPSGAIQLEFDSIGTQFTPLFMQHIYPVVAGTVSANLMDGTATEVRIQCKGNLASVAGQTATSNDMKGSPFWSESKIIWKAGDPVNATGITDEIPFSFRIPEWISMPINFGNDLKCPTPPSYIFRADLKRKSSELVASVKYTLKVVIERKGLAKRDERLSVPFTYSLQHQSVNFIPSARRSALLHGTPLPQPASDPSSWYTHNSHKTLTKSGLFTLKDIDVDVTFQLPTPLLCGIGETLPFYASMSAANLKKLGKGSVGVKLMERRWTGSGGLGPGECYESTLSTAEIELDPSTDAEDGTVRAYRGTLSLTGPSSPSFKTPKLEVQHSIILALIENGLVKEELGSVPITLFHLAR